jgi:hypothetical protein
LLTLRLGVLFAKISSRELIQHCLQPEQGDRVRNQRYQAKIYAKHYAGAGMAATQKDASELLSSFGSRISFRSSMK